MATNWQELVPFYVNQTLSADEQRAFEAQLARDPALQREVAEWRVIGSAIWQGMNSPKNQATPPLSAGFYEQLQVGQDAAVNQVLDSEATVQSAPIVDFVARRQQAEQARRSNFPVTMVAGFIMTIFLGGFLLFIATRPQEDTAPDVASLLTSDAMNVTEQATVNNPVPTATGIGLVSPVAPTLTPSPLPTTTPLALPPASATALPTAVLPPTDVVLPLPQATIDSSTASLAVQTSPVPVVTWEGMILQPNDCSVFNVTQERAVLIHAQANRESVVVSRLPVNMAWRTLVRSAEGWYQIVNPGQWMGWVAPEDVSLQGDCSNLILPSATPNFTPTIPASSLPVPPEVYGVVTANFAEMRSAPSDSAESEILLVTERGQEWLLQEYVEFSPEIRWYLTTLPDGRYAWLYVDDIRVETRAVPAASPTPTVVGTRTPIPTPGQ